MARRKQAQGHEYTAAELFTLGGGVRVRFGDRGTARRSHRLDDDGDGWHTTREPMHIKAGEVFELEQPIARHLARCVHRADEPEAEAETDGTATGNDSASAAAA